MITVQIVLLDVQISDGPVVPSEYRKIILFFLVPIHRIQQVNVTCTEFSSIFQDLIQIALLYLVTYGVTIAGWVQ